LPVAAEQLAEHEIAVLLSAFLMRCAQILANVAVLVVVTAVAKILSEHFHGVLH
jgi:hypothetical protein